MKLLAILLCLLCVTGEFSAQQCEAEDCSDQSSLLMTRIGVERKEREYATQDACAVCFIGELRNLNETSDGLRRNLLLPIASGGVNVDVFVAAPRKGPFGMDDFGLTHSRSTDNALGRIAIRDFRWQPEPAVKELEDMLTRSAPKKALEFYKGDGLVLGPLFGKEGNEFRMYKHEAECAQMIEQWEEAHQLRYKWVVRTRADFMWLTPHPPLSLMVGTDKDVVWTFDTEAYDAVNDRHVVGGRDVMINGELSKMKVLMSGDPVIYTPMGFNKLRDEWFSKLLFQAWNIHVAQMPTLAFASLCPSWSLYCTRKPGVQMYDNEVNHAKSNSKLWLQPNSCWAKASKKKVDIKQNCSHK